jgi:hypothetical protein
MSRVHCGLALAFLSAALSGCIQSSHDIGIGKDSLAPEFPIVSGIYQEGPDTSATVTRDGDGYIIFERSKRMLEKGKSGIVEDTHRVKFLKIHEFPQGYIIQKNTQDVRFDYCFAQIDARAGKSTIALNCPDGRDWSKLSSKLKMLTKYSGTKAEDLLFNDIVVIEETETLSVLRAIAKLDLKMSYGRKFVQQ